MFHRDYRVLSMSIGTEREESDEISREKCEEIIREAASLLDKLSSASTAQINLLVMTITISISVFAFSISLYNALKPEYSYLGTIITSVFSAVFATWIMLNILRFGPTRTLFVVTGVYNKLVSLHIKLLSNCMELYCKEASASTLCSKIDILLAGIMLMKKPFFDYPLRRLLKLEKR